MRRRSQRFVFYGPMLLMLAALLLAANPAQAQYRRRPGGWHSGYVRGCVGNPNCVQPGAGGYYQGGYYGQPPYGGGYYQGGYGGQPGWNQMPVLPGPQFGWRVVRRFVGWELRWRWDGSMINVPVYAWVRVPAGPRIYY